MLASYRWHRLLALPIALFVALALVAITGGPSSATTHSTKAGLGASATHKVVVKKHTKAERRETRRQLRLKEIRKAIRVAAAQKGDRYRYGGTGPGSFDCSGLTQYSFKRAGVRLPRTSGAQYAALRHISKRHLKKGDLVYFARGGHVYHAAIYWGKRHGHRLILHASRPGTPVGVSKIWTSGYRAATARIKKA